MLKITHDRYHQLVVKVPSAAGTLLPHLDGLDGHAAIRSVSPGWVPLVHT